MASVIGSTQEELNIDLLGGQSVGQARTGDENWETEYSKKDEDDAASGALRLFGRWTLLNRETKDTGTLVFKVENRHRLGTDIPPSIRTRIRYRSWACGRGSRSDRR